MNSIEQKLKMLISLTICLMIVLFIAGGLSTPSGSDSFKISKYVNFPCNTDAYCHSVINTNCQNGMCKCLSGYIQDRNLCLYKLSQTRKDCKSNYARNNDVCYGLPGAECSKPSDCLSSSYSCVSGTCRNVDNKDNNKVISKKPGISSYWIKDSDAGKVSQRVLVGPDGVLSLYVCRIIVDIIPIPGKLRANASHSECIAAVNNKELSHHYYELLVGSNVEWRTIEYTLDKALYGGQDDNGNAIFNMSSNGSPYKCCKWYPRATFVQHMYDSI